jgi:hypothetical protein
MKKMLHLSVLIATDPGGKKTLSFEETMNQSQNSALSHRPDVGVSFKQRILGWVHVQKKRERY